MFFCPLLIRSRMASRNCTLPSPRVIRPLKSRTLTPSTSREAIISATEVPPCWYYGYSTLAVPVAGKCHSARLPGGGMEPPCPPSLYLRKCPKAYRPPGTDVLQESTRSRDAI